LKRPVQAVEGIRVCCFKILRFEIHWAFGFGHLSFLG
jgi:hypothetical protein